MTHRQRRKLLTRELSRALDRQVVARDGAGEPSVTLRLARSGARLLTAAFASHGEQIIATASDNTLRVWSLSDPGAAPIELPVGEWVSGAEESPDGRRVLTTSMDAAARVWDLATPAQPALILRGPVDRDSCFNCAWSTRAMFSPDGSRVLTVWPGRTAWLWDVRTGPAQPTKFGDGLNVTSAIFSPDGGRIATGSQNGAIRVWDGSGATPKTVRKLPGPSSAVYKLAFSPDGAKLAAANSNEVWFWNLNETEPAPKLLEGQISPIDQLEFSADGGRLLTAAPDNFDAIRIWDIAGPRPGSLVLDIGDTHNRLVGAQLAPDSESLLASYSDGAVRIFPIPSADRLVDFAKRSLTRCLTPAQREEFGLTAPSTSPAERRAVKRPPC